MKYWLGREPSLAFGVTKLASGDVPSYSELKLFYPKPEG
jgi:hypothetical protein